MQRQTQSMSEFEDLMSNEILTEEDRTLEACLLDFIKVVLNKGDLSSLQKSFNEQIVADILFKLDNEEFSDLISSKDWLMRVKSRLNNFLGKKGMDIEVQCDVKKLETADFDEICHFLIDLIAMVKVFNPPLYKVVEGNMDPDKFYFLDNIIQASVDHLSESFQQNLNMNSRRNGSILREIDEEGENKELMQLQMDRIETQTLIEKLRAELSDKSLEIINIRNDLRKGDLKSKVLETNLNERCEERIQNVTKIGDLMEEIKRLKIDNKKLRDAGADYLVQEEVWVGKLHEKEVKVGNLTREVVGLEQSINVYELQLKEFAKMGVRFKNEKEEFKRLREVVVALKRGNREKNQMLYYFHYTHHQLEVEKLKLDHYIKLCQIQIQKLTSTEKELIHENEILKALNQNLMQIGQTGGPSRPNLKYASVGNLGERDIEADVAQEKLIRLLKDNIRVSLMTSPNSLYKIGI